jgi:hypothetical protein
MSENYITFEFRIKYITNQGEEIYILGDNDDFGHWKAKKFKLDWNENNIWKKEYKMKINSKNIQYKFICAHNNCHDPNQFRWEDCPNRILSSTDNIQNLKRENGKYILEQFWNHFCIIFSLHYQMKSSNDSLFILGGDGLGYWDKNKINDFKMILEKDDNYKDVWKKRINIEITDKKKVIMDLEYKYLFKNNEYEEGINRHVMIIFDKDKLNDEDKFFYLTNPKEYKLLINSIIEIEDSIID